VSVIGELASFVVGAAVEAFRTILPEAPAPLGGQGEVASLLIDPSYDSA